MGQAKPDCQNPKERLSNNREVSLGFSKKISIDEAHRCPQCAQPVCLAGCPLGIDIPGFIRLLREGDAVSALERIKQANPFPAICGRICSAPCENACIFHEEGAPISIRTLERYASDNGATQRGRQKSLQAGTSINKKIAIVGSGPSAMMAASFLLKAGFKVVMFEACNQPGGLLRYGVPQFRLPEQILDAQFEELESQGLELHTNVFVGRTKPLEELTNGFDAVLLALGASLPNFSSQEGEALAGVYYAEEFLMRLQSLSKENILASAANIFRGAKTVVIGNGHAAADAARLAARLGQEVRWIFDGLEEEIGIAHDELKQTVEEGIMVQAPFDTLRIKGQEGKVSSVQAQALEIVEGASQLTLQASKESPLEIEAQTVILANGQRANPFLSKTTIQLKSNPNGTIWVDPQSSMTSIEKVFAVASTVKGPMVVVEALADGKKIANQIATYLNP